MAWCQTCRGRVISSTKAKKSTGALQGQYARERIKIVSSNMSMHIDLQTEFHQNFGLSMIRLKKTINVTW